GYGELFAAQLPADLPGRPYFEEMQWAADRAAALTRRLLDFCRQTTGGAAPGPADVAAVARAAAGMLAHLVQRTVSLDVDAPGGAGLAAVDPRLVEQVVVNLVLNARDATPVGGRVSIA